MKPWIRNALIAVPAIEAVGTLAGFLSNSGYGNPWFDALDKPAFMPPGPAFPVAWTILYALIGLALARILALPASGPRRTALTLFFIQLALNFMWSPVFFGQRQIVAGFAIVLAMLLVASATTVRFWRLDRPAGIMMLPYLCWLCLALALNVEIYRLNPGA